MELHNHFIEIANTQLVLREIIGDSEGLETLLVARLMQCFETVIIMDANPDPDEKEVEHTLKLLRYLLCELYRLYHRNIRDEIMKFQSLFELFSNFLVVRKLYSRIKDNTYLYDIITVQMVLFDENWNLNTLFDTFQLTKANGSLYFYIRVLECFLNAWELHYFLEQDKPVEISKVEKLRKNILLMIISMLRDIHYGTKCSQAREIQAFHSFIKKMIQISNSSKILSPYIRNVKLNLSTLIFYCDFLFPTEESSIIEVDYLLVYFEEFWKCIQENLVSDQVAERKQAMYIFKRIVEFIDINQEKIVQEQANSKSPIAINPFICNKVGGDKESIKAYRNNFILVFEALEEKQKHLVIPSLSLVDGLISAWEEHSLCGNCFDFRWIYSIFSRLFDHDNNAVVKWGLLRALNLAEEAYDYDAFVLIIIKSLNDIFLYEKTQDGADPEIKTALTNWFIKIQSEKNHLVEKFLCYCCSFNWGPIALYYVLESVLATADKLKGLVALRRQELNKISALVSNSKLHCAMLRGMSERALIKMLPNFTDTKNIRKLSKFIMLFDDKSIKQPDCWNALVECMAKITPENAKIFVDEFCEIFQGSDQDLNIPMKEFALILQLLYEAKVIFQTVQCPVRHKVKTLLLLLDKADSRPYSQVSLLLKLIDFLYSLFDLKRQIPEFFFKFFISHKQTIFRFVLGLLRNSSLEYNDRKISLRVFKKVDYYSQNTVYPISIIDKNCESEVNSICLKIIDNAEMTHPLQLLHVLETWSFVSRSFAMDDERFVQILKDLLKIPEQKRYSEVLTGEKATRYYVILSKLIGNHVVNLELPVLQQKRVYLEVMSFMLDTAGNEVLIYLCEVIKLYATGNNEDEEQLKMLHILMKVIWACNFGSHRDKVFWDVTEILTECLHSEEVLGCRGMTEICSEFTSTMLKEGLTSPILRYILVTYMRSGYFKETLLHCLLHGQVVKSDRKILMQTMMTGDEILETYKEENLKLSEFNAFEYANRQYNIDAAVRAAAVVQLRKRIDENVTFADSFLPLVLNRLELMQNKRYYTNSQLHRYKHRFLQTLLIIQPYLKRASMQALYQFIRDSIIRDTEQHSIRLLKEWLLIRIYLSNSVFLSDLWSFLDKIYQERPSSANTIIGIIWHIAKAMPKEKLDVFLRVALPKIGLFCTGQQFNMRLFGQVFYIKLYGLLAENSTVKEEYINFYHVIYHSVNSGNFKGNPVQIDNDFYYSEFDPLNHYNLETIYYHFPRLCNMCQDEWIPLKLFHDHIILLNAQNGIPVSNDKHSLATAEVSHYILKSNDNSKSEDIDIDSELGGDIQKKITPWRQMLPNDDELLQLSHMGSIYGIKNKYDIIIVASFVEKPQNLGGIARTCEIFGAKELVISNLKQTEDKEFQALSVSADKWLKITEVKTHSVINYLTEMKFNQYSLIGAEQTANSVKLSSFKFPKKTVLVLGNEKNGIPANLINYLDACVEVPQFGVIRSLNVHVTSAICIWEYMRQNEIII